jgi:hypothetical protein
VSLRIGAALVAAILLASPVAAVICEGRCAVAGHVPRAGGATPETVAPDHAHHHHNAPDPRTVARQHVASRTASRVAIVQHECAEAPAAVAPAERNVLVVVPAVFSWFATDIDAARLGGVEFCPSTSRPAPDTATNTPLRI